MITNFCFHEVDGSLGGFLTEMQHVIFVLQFSSLGSLDEKWLSELTVSMSSGVSSDKSPLGIGKPHIIWPTVEDVRCSIEVLLPKFIWNLFFCSPSIYFVRVIISCSVIVIILICFSLLFILPGMRSTICI